MTKPTDNVYPEVDKDDFYPGLTKREYFAAMAMQGLLASPRGFSHSEQKMAEFAVAQADTLIESLNK